MAKKKTAEKAGMTKKPLKLSKTKPVSTKLANITDPVKFMRLSTGEDIISEVVEVDTGTTSHFLLMNPMRVLYYMLDNSESVKVNLVPWVFTRIVEDQRFVLGHKDVILLGEPSASMKGYYAMAAEQIARADLDQMDFSDEAEDEEDFEADDDDDESAFDRFVERQESSATFKRKLH